MCITRSDAHARTMTSSSIASSQGGYPGTSGTLRPARSLKGVLNLKFNRPNGNCSPNRTCVIRMYLGGSMAVLGEPFAGFCADLLENAFSCGLGVRLRRQELQGNGCFAQKLNGSVSKDMRFGFHCTSRGMFPFAWPLNLRFYLRPLFDIPCITI